MTQPVDSAYSIRWTDLARDSRTKLSSRALEALIQIEPALVLEPLVSKIGEVLKLKSGGYLYRHPSPQLDVLYAVNGRVIEVESYWEQQFSLPGTVFCCYTRRERRWLRSIKAELKEYEEAGRIGIWDDGEIRVGQEWRRVIKQNLESARAAILLVSPAFLNSVFIQEVELPALLSQAEEGQTTVFWVLVEGCEVPEEILRFHGPNPELSLCAAEDAGEEVLEAHIRAIGKKIREALEADSET